MEWLEIGLEKNRCKELIEKYNLKDNIDLLGFKENPYPILKNSKILCVTSKYEGYGLAAIESIVLETPVVATNVGGLKEIINNKLGKLCSTDEEFEKEIQKLLLDEKYYATKKEECKYEINNIKNIENYIERLLFYYE